MSQPEKGRGDAPGALSVAALQQLREDRHERPGQRGIRDERAEQVRDLERDREGVDGAGDAEVVGRDHLAHETEEA
jgi:hypothetical protein